MRRVVSVLAFLSLFVAAPLFGQIADGDALYAKRAEGAQGAIAKAGTIDAAIAAYQRATKGSDDLEARWKLMRALRFKGAHVARDQEAKKGVFSDAKKVGTDAMVILSRQLAARGVKGMDKASEKQVADAARVIPNATQVIYWDTVNWGEWAIAYGKMAAVKEGAADRIKRQSTIVMLIDPKFEGGGGARVLGRLHNQTPRVPFITGWASGSEAVKFLKQSLAQEPSNKLTKIFLAEALSDANKGARPEAAKLLREILSSPNDPAHAVEDVDAQNDAKAMLAAWGMK